MKWLVLSIAIAWVTCVVIHVWYPITAYLLAVGCCAACLCSLALELYRDWVAKQGARARRRIGL